MTNKYSKISSRMMVLAMAFSLPIPTQAMHAFVSRAAGTTMRATRAGAQATGRAVRSTTKVSQRALSTGHPAKQVGSFSGANLGKIALGSAVLAGGLSANQASAQALSDFQKKSSEQTEELERAKTKKRSKIIAGVVVLGGFLIVGGIWYYLGNQNKPGARANQQSHQAEDPNIITNVGACGVSDQISSFNGSAGHFSAMLKQPSHVDSAAAVNGMRAVELYSKKILAALQQPRSVTVKSESADEDGIVIAAAQKAVNEWNQCHSLAVQRQIEVRLYGGESMWVGNPSRAE